MGFFANLRKKERIEKAVNEYFELLQPYSPSFSTFEGGLYEMELTRSAIHSFATHVSKLKPEVKGSGNEAFARMLQYKPNPLMDTKKYLYRLATVYMVDNTAFIAPLYDKYGEINGYYPLATNKCRIITGDNGQKYLQYEIVPGHRSAIELERVGIMNQYQYQDEMFGESNRALWPTMDLIHANNEGIQEGIKSSANVRFMAKLAQTLKPKDIEDERKRFVETNLSSSNGGVLLFDQKYEDIKQITSQPYVVNDAQMKQIKDSVFDYFGTNERILTNNFTSAEWNAYYEGKIEPFALEASLVHTNMTFSKKEIAYGNEIIFSSNRLQYLSSSERVQLVTQLFDRGFINQDEGREIFNMPPLNTEASKKYYIRLEYGDADRVEDDITVSDESEAENE